MKGQTDTSEIRKTAVKKIYSFYANENNKNDITKFREYRRAIKSYNATIPKPTQICAEQKISKPAWDVTLNRLITDDNLKYRLSRLMSYCTEQGLHPKWYAANHYHLKYKSKVIITVILGEGIADLPNLSQIILGFWDIVDVNILSTEMKKFCTENIRFCGACNPRHNHEQSAVCLGKKINNVCRLDVIEVFNPSLDTIESIIKLIPFIMQAIIKTIQKKENEK